MVSRTPDFGTSKGDRKVKLIARNAARSTLPKQRERATLPTQPGRYHWSEWKCTVEVYRKRGGVHLYVCPPGGVEVRVTPQIAGTFRHVGALSHAD
jgi:hypothetical protein